MSEVEKDSKDETHALEMQSEKKGTQSNASIILCSSNATKCISEQELVTKRSYVPPHKRGERPDVYRNFDDMFMELPVGHGLNNAPWLALEVVPNFIGSIFFIISAIYGLLEIGHGRLLVINPKHIGWWISIVNAMGCLWFMQAAIASLPLNLTAATILDPQISIKATLLGSIAFTTVGILSLAECSEDFISRLEGQI